MKKIIVFPTWVLIGLFRPLIPRVHPWYGRKFTLDNWAQNATELTRSFSVFFWISGLCIVITLIHLWKNILN